MSPKLETLRADIEKAQCAIDATEAAPKPVDEAIEAIMAAYDRNLETSFGASAIYELLFEQDPLAGPAPFSIDHSYVELQQQPGKSTQILFALMGRAAVEAQARHVLSQHAARFGPGLPAEQRAAQRAELKAKLRKLEFDEEKLIISLESSGDFVPRRREADPKIILEVWKATL
jgi:hypothetical protein